MNIDNQMNNFKQSLNNECYSFGWGRGVRIASNLYEDNLRLEIENEKMQTKLDEHKKEIKRLQDIITGGINELSVNMISDSLSKVTSAEIFGDTL
jgi:regulator of replication initiation timing